MTTIFFIIHGEPASKSNSRKLVTIKGRPAFIKSDKARKYVKQFEEQCPQMGESMFLDDVEVEMTVYYASRRPDLDESVILDAMQVLISKNDGQGKRSIIQWGLEKENPRAEITVRLMEPSAAAS